MEELATVLGVTPRSVRRYIQELSWDTEIESVQAAPNEPHIIRILPSEQRRTVPLRRTQAYALLATRRLFDVFRGSALFEEIDLAFRQIQQIARRPGGKTAGEIVPRSDLDERFGFLVPATGNYGAHGEILDELFRALAERRYVVVYVRSEMSPPGEQNTSSSEQAGPRSAGASGEGAGTKGKTTRLRIAPEGLFADGGSLYVAYNSPGALTEPERVLRVDRIVEARVVDGTKGLATTAPAPSETFARGRFGTGFGAERYTVVVEFDARAAELIRRRRVHPDQRIAVAADGRARLGFPAGDLEAVASWVLSFGDGARAIEPPELANMIRRSLTAALRKY